MNPISSKLKAAALVTGAPHLLKPELNDSYETLANALSELGDSLAERGVERIIYYSTQWLSVLGQSFQARADLKGMHVDENWYELGDLPFDFKVDAEFATAMAKNADKAGYQTKMIDYDGFPVDTATIVADKLLNKGRFKTNMVACCVYSDGPDTEKLAGTIREAIDASDKNTAVVCVSMLSGSWHSTEIDMREDQISSKDEDVWNKKILTMLEAGQHKDLVAAIPEYAGACRVDMGFKAYNFLTGAGVFEDNRGGKLRAYGPVYGTGNAVIEF
jgi:2-aminophenol/2-amino-5-chlorophenol 1,6-dioxygenase subunit alpha